MQHIKKVKELSFTDESTNAFEQIGDFKQYNIIYGLNGVGKSSISRLINYFSAFIRDRDKDVQGTLILNSGEELTTDLNEKHNNIFVFNRDFIEENLIFHDDNNKMKNNYVEVSISSKTLSNSNEIEELNNKIKGLQESVKGCEEKANNIIRKCQDDLVDKCSVTKHKYSVDTLKKYLENHNVSEKNMLNDNDLNIKAEFLKNYQGEFKQLNNIKRSSLIDSSIKSLLTKLQQLLIKDSIKDGAIKRISNDSVLNKWMSDMYTHMINEPYKYDHSQCPFCETKEINNKENIRSFTNFFQTLKNHFNYEYQLVKKNVNEIINNINFINIEKLKNEELPQKDFNFIIKESNEEFYKIKKNIENIYSRVDLLIRQIKQLAEKKFEHIQSENINNYDADFNNCQKQYDEIINDYNKHLQEINKIIDENNTLLENKNIKRNEFISVIRNHFIEKYYKDFHKFKKEINSYQQQQKEAENKIKSLVKEKKQEILNFQQEKLAGFNNFIKHIGIFSIEEDKLKFVKKNKDTAIKKLSEGEKNIILFCYFIIELNSSKDEKKVIVVDDPHCSLDKDYLGRIVELIRAEVYKNNSTSQIFILSHSEDFLIEYNVKLKNKTTQYYELTKCNNRVSLSQVKNKWNSYAVKYLDIYKQLKEFHDKYEKRDHFSSYKADVRTFLERLSAYLFPSYDTALGVEKIGEYIGIRDKSLINILAHDSDMTQELEDKQKYDLISDIIANNSTEKLYVKENNKDFKAYIKEHLKILNDAYTEHFKDETKKE